MLPHADPYHTPILVEAIVEHALGGPHARMLDLTLGGGGHAEALLTASAASGAVLYACDRDPEAIAYAQARLERFGSRFRPLLANYSEIDRLLAHTQGPVDAVVLDAGVSSHQLDEPARGFSHRRDGPLDMRMGPDAEPLIDWLARQDYGAIARALAEFGELARPAPIARAILEARDAGRLTTTGQLAEIVRGRAQRPGRRARRADPATLAFQALRIAVNDELGHLERLLERLTELCAPSARASIMTFHSLEDRRVKRALARLADPCRCPPGLVSCVCRLAPRIAPPAKLVRASPGEVARNPRARSARLRRATFL